MIHLDLLPEEFRVEEKTGFQLASLASSKSILIFLVFCIGLSVLMLLFKTFIAVPQYKAAQDLYFQHSPSVARMQALKAEISRAQDQERLLNVGMSRPFYWTDVMNGLSESLVKGIWLNQIHVKKIKIGTTAPAANSATGRELPVFANILIISGEVISGEDPTATVSQFTSNLIQNNMMSKMFQEVSVKELKKKSDKNNLYSFEVHAIFAEANGRIFEAFLA